MAKRTAATKGWWEVRTGDGSEAGDTSKYLGTFYGYIDEIALRLADKAKGWWCDGKITFIPATQPKAPSLPKKVHGKADIVVEGLVDGKNYDEFMKNARAFFKGRPVLVKENSMYNSFAIVPAIKQKGKVYVEAEKPKAKPASKAA